MMDAEKWKKEADRQHDMLVWLAKRYAKDVPCHKCTAKMSMCNQQKRRTMCSALILEAAELAVSKAGEQAK